MKSKKRQQIQEAQSKRLFSKQIIKKVKGMTNEISDMAEKGKPKKYRKSVKNSSSYDPIMAKMLRRQMMSKTMKLPNGITKKRRTIDGLSQRTIDSIALMRVN